MRNTYPHLPYFKDMPNMVSLGHVDSEPIAEELAKATQDEWEKYHYLRHGHVSRYTIPLIWSSLYTKPTEKMKRITIPEFEQFIPLCQPMIDAISKAYPRSRILRMFFTRMSPGTEIRRHVDTSPSNRAVRRCHLPILTNEHVLFYIDGVNTHHPIGEAFEINNTVVHGVTNDGETNRDHLMVDVLSEEFDAEIEDLPWERRGELNIA